MKFYLLMKSKLLIRTVVVLLRLAENEFFFSAYQYENANICWHFSFLSAEKITCTAAELSKKKVLINLETR